MHRLATLAIVLASTALGIGAAELALRALRPELRLPFRVRAYVESERAKFCRYDELLGWTGKPDVEGRFECVDCRHSVRQNRYGFRGTEYPLERSTRPRLVVLGDSFVWGFGVEDEEIFTSVLESESESGLEVVNLGVSGYGTDQELLLWRSLGQRFRPDDVLLLVYPHTDLQDVYLSERYGYPKPVFRPGEDGGFHLANVPVPRPADAAWQPVAGLQQRPDVHWLGRLAGSSASLSAVFLALARVDGVRERLEAARILPRRGGDMRWDVLPYVRPPDAPVAQAWRVFAYVLARLAEEVEASGARLHVAAAPTVFQVYDDVWERLRTQQPLPTGKTWEREAPQRRIAELAAELDVDWIALLPDLRRAGRRDPYLYFPWNQHWRPAAHRVVARTLSAALAATEGG